MCSAQEEAQAVEAEHHLCARPKRRPPLLLLPQAQCWPAIPSAHAHAQACTPTSMHTHTHATCTHTCAYARIRGQHRMGAYGLCTEQPIPACLAPGAAIVLQTALAAGLPPAHLAPLRRLAVTERAKHGLLVLHVLRGVLLKHLVGCTLQVVLAVAAQHMEAAQVGGTVRQPRQAAQAAAQVGSTSWRRKWVAQVVSTAW